MKSLADKVQTLIPFLKQQGTLFLLALFERDDVADKWDLVISSDWSDKGTSAAIKELSKKLIPLLSPKELTSLSRIAVIPSSEQAVYAMASSVTVESGQIHIQNCNFMGLQINHAIVLSSNRPAVSANYQQLESTTSVAVNESSTP
jgi:hypothetical protein